MNAKSWCPRFVVSLVQLLLLTPAATRAEDLIGIVQRAQAHDATYLAARRALDAAAERPVQARAAILGRLQIDQLVQQGGVVQAAFDPNGAQLGLQAAAGPFLVLEIFAAGLAALGVPGVVAFGHDDLAGVARLALPRRIADPGPDVQPRPVQQPGHLGQIRPLAREGDDAVIVVHRRGQRLHRPAPPLVREIADHLAAMMEDGHGRVRADRRGDLGEFRPEIGARQRGIGRDHRAPPRHVRVRQGLGPDEFDLHHASSLRGQPLHRGLAAW